MATLKKNAAVQEIEVQEIARHTTGGDYVYAIYKNKVVRRAAKRGRPIYNQVSQFKLHGNESPRPRTVAASSQLGKALLALENA